MSKPLGRDRLGRLVYEGDWFVIPDSHKGIQNLGAIRWMCGNRDFIALLSEQTVDLAASPKLTNYERYFGDMDRRSVVRAVKAICDDTCARRPYDCVKECPFDDWYKFNVSSGGLCLAAFVDWLDMEATV